MGFHRTSFFCKSILLVELLIYCYLFKVMKFVTWLFHSWPNLSAKEISAGKKVIICIRILFCLIPCFISAVGDFVSEDEVVGEVETDKVI